MYNTNTRYGWVAIVLHWLMAVAIIGMFGLGWYMVDLTYYDSLYKTLPFIHKSIGIILIAVFLFRIYWRLTNPVPEALKGTSLWEHKIAKLVHRTFYWIIPIIMVSGYLISTADGSAISVFDLFEVPASITSIPEQEDSAGLVHKYLTYALIALAGLHAAAAVKHHVLDGDATLRRMFGSKSI